ncbi:putative calcium-activated outward-rectifying potassium channel 6 [Morus notabilis]|uniref:Putative calcium-activated outward-rectifying potassium channel 6 n=1 Tax=Morus notabilis TaxID=981085 RepID=W9S366_9ROSA|nr:two-pore potassium channel 3 [Morus notabilis]EXB86569.1 putative calcium-activated outward-rectifying potassium channel 6 [Morus notabilis]
METEPLLPYLSPRRKPPPLPPQLFPLPEHDEITLPLTPSELKDRLIFGPSSSPQESSPIVDALTLSLSSKPSSSSSPSDRPSTPRDSAQSWLLDPNYPLFSKTNLHRSKTAPAMAVLNEIHNRHAEPRPQFVSPSIVRQSFVLLLVYLSFGVLIYSFNRDDFVANETHPVVDALYFCIVTMCTIGYGDITPNSTTTKVFSILFVLVGFGFVDILLSGMVSYVLDLQESYLLRGVKKDHVGEKKEHKNSYIIDWKKGRMRIRMKVGLALGVVVLCIGLGVGVMHFVERLGWLDSFYLSVMSVTTVGYGDRAFKSMPGRIFASIWLLVSTLAVARAFLYLAEARVDKRHRKMAKWILGQDMTVAEFLAADIDNNGFVSKSEYVIYKLKEMGKISEKDIMLICNKFDMLDTGNCGKITLADLMETNQSESRDSGIVSSA